MPEFTTDSASFVYDLIKEKQVEWGNAVKAQTEAMIEAADASTMVATMTNVRDAVTKITMIKDNMGACIKKHNQYFRDEKAYLTMMKETASKIDTLVAASYDETAYEETTQLTTDLKLAMDSAYTATA